MISRAAGELARAGREQEKKRWECCKVCQQVGASRLPPFARLLLPVRLRMADWLARQALEQLSL